MPKVREIHIPPKWRGEMLIWFQRQAAVFFPGVPIRRKGGAGSGDPYLIVDRAVVHTLPRWTELIDGLMHTYQGAS